MTLLPASAFEDFVDGCKHCGEPRVTKRLCSDCRDAAWGRYHARIAAAPENGSENRATFAVERTDQGQPQPKSLVGT